MIQLNFFKNTILLINNSFYCDYNLSITHFNKEITHFNKKISHFNKKKLNLAIGYLINCRCLFHYFEKIADLSPLFP